MDSIIICSNRTSDTTVKLLDFFYLNEFKIPIGIIDVDGFSPDTLDEKQNAVIVRKKAFSMSYRDRAILFSMYGRFYNQNNDKDNVAFFSCVGSEFIGEVIARGNNVKHLKIGDRVIPNAQYPLPGNAELHPGIPTNQASRRAQLFHKDQLVKIPKELPNEVASSITIAGHTVYSMMEKAELKAGNNVLVTSLKSNTSMALVSALKSKDVNIWGLTTSSHHVEKFLSIGINKVVINDSRTKDFLEVEEIKEFVKETGGFDVVFDPFFDLHLSKVTSCMNVNSKYLSCGFYKQLNLRKVEPEEVPEKSVNEIMIECILKNISIIGNCLGEKRHLEQAIDEYLKGNFDIPIDSVITGNDIAYFFDRTFNDPDRFGKVVYKYDD